MDFLHHPNYDALLSGSPLRRRGVCVAVSAGLLALLGFAILSQLDMLAGMRRDVEAVFFEALLLASLLSLVPIAILWYLDRRERETPWLFAVAFFWGAVIATGLALPLNNAFFHAIGAWVAKNPVIEQTLGPDATLMLVAPVAGPLVEEITKGLGVLALLWLLHAEFDNMRDGFVYGALVGLGFTWFEAPLYVAQGYAKFGDAPWGMQLGWRYSLFGLGGHALFTGLFGASLGLALQTRRRWLKVLAPVAGLVLAITAHVVNNVLPLLLAIVGAASGEAPPQATEPPPDIGFVQAFAGGSFVNLVIFLPFVAIIGVALWRSGVWERRVIREELAGEVDRTVSEAEYEAIIGDRMFRTRRIDRLHRRTSAALVNAQHELAFRKRRVRDAGRDPEADPLVAARREEIRELRALA